MTIPILQIRKQRLREVRYLSLGPTANKLWTKNSHLSPLMSMILSSPLEGKRQKIRQKQDNRK